MDPSNNPGLLGTIGTVNTSISVSNSTWYWVAGILGGGILLIGIIVIIVKSN